MSGILESATVVIISKKGKDWVRWQPIKKEHEAIKEPEE